VGKVILRRIVAVDGWFNVIRQVMATCPSTRAHWRHLANTIELLHHSADSSPQPKWQMDRFSRFCTAYGRKCLYITMGTPIHKNCPFPWGIWTSHVTHDAFGPCESTAQTAPRSVQPSLHRWLQSVSILYNGLPVSPSKLPLPRHRDLMYVVHWPHLSPECKYGNLIVSSVFAGLTSVTDW